MNKEIHTQVVIIGSGPAGYSAAFRCSDLGLETILIERYSSLGGVCLNVGCIPSKSLLHIAKVIKESKELSALGVDFHNPVIDINKIRLWKNKIIDKLTAGLSSMRQKRKINLIQGNAKFHTDHSIIVEHAEKKTIIFFKYAIIATGSYPISIPSMPFDSNQIWNSTDALLLNNIPNRLLIIGGGIIGIEMATIYSALGSKVDVIDRFTQFLPTVDQDITDIYLKSVNNNFNIMLNSNAEIVKLSKTGVLVNINKNNSSSELHDYNNVLVAIGRKPNIHDLGMKEIGIELNDFGFISVDKQLKTSISHIYAVGDVTGFPMLAHKGMHEGRLAAEVISGKKHYFEPKVIPSVAYTEPEIAWVGLTEKDAQHQNIDYAIASFPWNFSGRALASNCQNGLTKIIFDKCSNQIIGGSIVGTNAGELIGEIGLAIEMGCDAEDIALTIHAHPTLHESIGVSAEIFTGTVTDLLNIKSHL